MSVTVTEDHSLFNEAQKKIKPSKINGETRLEYYTKDVVGDRQCVSINTTRAKRFARWLKNGTLDRVALPMLNTDDKAIVKVYLDELNGWDYSVASKTCQAGIQFLKKKIQN